MIEHVRALLAQAGSAPLRRCVLGEYLQARILASLQSTGVFTRWAFVGGTALRFLFDLPRFSEDLGFSLQAPGLEVGLSAAVVAAARTLALEGYSVETTVDLERTVNVGVVAFPGLEHQFGLSPRAGQKLKIKLELDTNPPAGASLATTLVRRHMLLNLCHHDRASLLAGKLHALLSRPWTKGRDLYDLAWYLADRRWPSPNLTLLNAALAQTDWPGPELTADSWRDVLLARLSTLDWARARADVQPFLERPAELELVSQATLTALVRPA